TGRVLAVVALSFLALAAPQALAADLLVFAAASLKNALDEANAAYAKETGLAVTVSYAASPALARQIELRAPADLFISAELDWMDQPPAQHATQPQTPPNTPG